MFFKFLDLEYILPSLVSLEGDRGEEIFRRENYHGLGEYKGIKQQWRKGAREKV